MIITFFDLSRLEYAIMLLSTCLSTAACVSLYDAVSCDVVVYGPSPSIQMILDQVLGLKAIACRPMIQRAFPDQAQASPPAPVLSRSCALEEQENRTAVILHSSGLTGLPKPIFLAHQH